MNDVLRTADAQAIDWNGVSGRAWVETQSLLDQVFEPFQQLLSEAVAARMPHRVLDVGCGTGATTLAAAKVLGIRGRSVGIDISTPMIATARARAVSENATVQFICADAQTHAFTPGSFDLFISRFGVMFFDDAVAAFTNLRRAATDDAELRLLVWRSAEENPFMTVAERAAAPLLPNLPLRKPDAPGQFAFADQHRVEHILAQSGWVQAEMRSVDISCSFPANELVRWFTQLGPLGRVLHEVDERIRARIIVAVRAGFDRYVHGDEVRFNAACSLVCARALPLPA